MDDVLVELGVCEELSGVRMKKSDKVIPVGARGLAQGVCVKSKGKAQFE